MKRSLILVLFAILAACEPISGDFTATPSNHTQTATHAPSATAPIIVTRPSVSQTPTASPTAHDTPDATLTAIAPFATPTIEHCENVPILYEVRTSLNVRIEAGTNHERIGGLIKGDRFTGTLCSTTAGVYAWVQIVQANHALNGGWVVWYRLDTGERFLD